MPETASCDNATGDAGLLNNAATFENTAVIFEIRRMGLTIEIIRIVRTRERGGREYRG